MRKPIKKESADYKPITSGEDFKDTLDHFQNLCEKAQKQLQELELSIKFKEEKSRYWYWAYTITYRHGKVSLFMTNVRPKERETLGSTGVSALFVKDRRGHRFLAHNGTIRPSKEGFLAFIGCGPRITVQGDNNSWFIVSRIDGISVSDFVNRINKVTQVVASFRNSDPEPPCKLDRHSPLMESENPEMDDSIEDELSEMARGGQGYGLSSKKRKAVENCAMKRAKKYYKNEGYQVEDTSRNNPYDLRCSTEEETIFIEVKGSTESGDKIFLTKNEVNCAKEKDRIFELFVVSEIEIIDKNAKTPKARGGKRRIIKPWKPKRKCLTPVTYSYNLACHDDS